MAGTAYNPIFRADTSDPSQRYVTYGGGGTRQAPISAGGGGMGMGAASGYIRPGGDPYAGIRATGNNSMLRATTPQTGVRPGTPAAGPAQGMPQGFPQMGGGMSITSAFGQERLPYQNTQQHVNQAVADIHQQNDPHWLAKLYGPQASSGVARSAGTEALIAPHLANASVASRYAQQAIPFERNQGNAQYQLGFDQGRSSDIAGQAENLFGVRQMQDNFALQDMLRQFGLLGNLFSQFGDFGGGF